MLPTCRRVKTVGGLPSVWGDSGGGPIHFWRCVIAQPVWVLSVDLQAKTATFATGMADAAKTARGSFNDIKEGARACGAETGYSMTEARHGVMLLGEEFGVHIPRALTSFLAGLGPIGGAMEAAFPFLAIAVGATLLLEHLGKLHEAGEKLTASQVTFGTTCANVLNGLDDKLLEVGIRADDLNGNHFAALEKQLKLINNQSMKELVKSFEEVARAADLSFGPLITSWYQFGSGAAGAKHSLEQFKIEYDALLSKKDEKGANDLLDEKLKREERILALQKQRVDNIVVPEQNKGNYDKTTEAAIALKKLGVDYDDKAIQAQTVLVTALRNQADAQQRIQEIRKLAGSNARQTTANKVDADDDKTARAQADAEKRGIELAEKMREAAYRAALNKLQENEREKIEATEKGSAARLQAIDAAIKEENKYGLQETGFYRSLLISRVEVTRQMLEEQRKLTAEAGKEEAEHTLKMDELIVSAERHALQLRVSQHRITAAQILAEELKISREEYQAKMTAYAQEIAALDKFGKDYENKLRAIQNKEKELTRQHENETTQLQQAANAKRLAVVTDAYNRMGEAAARTAAQSIMSGQNLGQAFERMGGQMLQTALTNLMQLETVQGRKRFGDARTAAADAWDSAGNPILGAIEAAAAFTAVMAFEKGGIVPGIGNTDSVPAMLTPGEGVIPKNVMEAARTGSLDGNSGPHYTVHVRPVYNLQAIDATGVQQMLDKHSGTLQRHVENTIRKLNR